MKALLQHFSGPEAGITPPFQIFSGLNRARRKKVLAIELGKWTTKAAVLSNQGDGLKLVGYVLQPAVDIPAGALRTGLADLLRDMYKQTGSETRHVVICLSMGDCVLRNAEMPNAKLSDLRRIVSINPQSFLQQDLKNHFFDCALLPALDSLAPPPPPPPPAEGTPAPEAESPKVVPLPSAKKPLRVLVGAATQQLVDDLMAACAEAGLILEEVTFAHVALLNAALFNLQAELRSTVTALVDIGFKTSTLSILFNGEVVLTRVINFGGDHITNGLAQAMEANARVAEAIKVTLPEKVEEHFRNVVSALTFEIRTAIDFFEKQFEIPVAAAFFSGASSRSKFLMDFLQHELNLPCKTWNPTSSMGLGLGEARAAELEASLGQLGSAIGAAQAWLLPAKLRINVLAARQEEQEAKRRDPLRWSIRAGALLVLFMLAWASLLAVERASKYVQLNFMERRLAYISKNSRSVSENVKKIAEMQLTLDHLEHQNEKRFRWAETLNALQFTTSENIQLIRFQMSQAVSYQPPSPPTNMPSGIVIPGKPASAIEQTSLLIGAKNYGDLSSAQKFIQKIASSPYFKEHLRAENPVLLKDRLPEQTDPLNPSRSFSLFTIECFFNQRIISNE